MKQFSVNEILDGIRSRDNTILRNIYQENFPSVRIFIIENRGDGQDAKDIFQEALVIIFRRVSKKKLTLNCSFGTYLYSICKVLWFKELEKRKMKKIDQKDLEGILDIESDLDFRDPDQARYALFHRHMNNLDKGCRKVLTLFYDNVPVSDITRIMGYSSDTYTRLRKHRCKEKLIAGIKEDPEFKELQKRE